MTTVYNDYRDCKRSGEGAAVSGRHIKRRVRVIASLATIAGALLTSLLLCSSFGCYLVSYNGEELGMVSSRQELISAVELAEAEASGILGQDVSLAGDVVVSAGLGFSDDGAEAVAGRLVESVEGILYQYAILVDGEPVARGEDFEELGDILEELLESYSTDNTVSVSFAEDVAVEALLVSEALESDPEIIAEMLAPESGEGILTVESRELVQEVGSLPYTTVVEYDDEGYSDEVTVLQSGRDGSFCASYLVSLENGVEVASVTAESHVLMDPTPEVVLVGSIPGSRTDSTGEYQWPAEGVITSLFGKRNVDIGSSNHKGVDIANASGTEVYAADGGTVIYASYSGGSGYGNLIKIQHDNGDVTYYAHLSKILVEEGDKVAQGDLIGKMGATGRASGPHLHFEVRPGGETPQDPLDYLPER